MTFCIVTMKLLWCCFCSRKYRAFFLIKENIFNFLGTIGGLAVLIKIIFEKFLGFNLDVKKSHHSSKQVAANFLKNSFLQTQVKTNEHMFLFLLPLLSNFMIEKKTLYHNGKYLIFPLKCTLFKKQLSIHFLVHWVKRSCS